MEGSFSLSSTGLHHLDEVVVQDDDSGSPRGRTALEVRILSPGRSTLNLRVNGDTTAADLELMVRQAYEIKTDARVRLLFGGKVLSEETALSQLSPSNLSALTIHCAVTFPPLSSSSSTSSAQRSAQRGTGRARREVPTEDNEPTLGFDRLRFMGFSEEEVLLARNQFRTSFITRMRPRPRANLSEREFRILEERFMSGEETVALPTNSAPLPPLQPNPLNSAEDAEEEGTHFDLVLGLILGFFFGLLVCYWLWERTAKHLTRRRFVGLLIGALANILIATIHVLKR